MEGNYANSTQTILNSLDAAGIHHGSWKKRVDCSQTASYLREQFPNLTWVSAKIEGTQLVLAVKENVDGYVIEEKADDPQNLVAKKEGTVVRIITRNGIPQVLPGDTCQAGDILVKGEIPLVNDSGETYDYSYVHADADIDLETTWYYYDTFPLSHTVRTYQKAEKKTPVFQISAYRFFLGNLLPENFVEQVAEDAYEKACEAVSDTMAEQTRAEDIEELRRYKKWLTSDERKTPKDKRDFVGRCLDNLENRLRGMAQKVAGKVMETLQNPRIKEQNGLSTLFQTNFFRLFFRYCTGV